MNTVRDGIIGVAIGDMLGVPVEFTERSERDADPVTGLREGGPNAQEKGTWSDDTSLTLCLAESLTKGFSLTDIAQSFLDWKVHAKWTARGVVFDMGRQTHVALNDIERILESGDTESLLYLQYEADEQTNGNGSLMRTLPLYFYLKEKGIEENFETIWQVSALTHGHIRSALACLIYLIMIDELQKQSSIQEAYRATQHRTKVFFKENDISEEEQKHFARLIEEDISQIDRDKLNGWGYVMNALEISFWALLTTRSFEEAVLKAINLGQDTDTNGAVTGGLAGIFYGIDSAPKDWYQSVARIDEIEQLCDTLDNKYKAVSRGV